MRENQTEMIWEKAKSNRSHCVKCHDYIDRYQKRLRVHTKFGIRDGFLFYCETCAKDKFGSLPGLACYQSDLTDKLSLTAHKESLVAAVKYNEFDPRVCSGTGRFYKYYRKITLG